MLNCELCNYFKETGSKIENRSKHVCEFTGFVFNKKVEDYDMENHPCFNVQINENPIVRKKSIA